MSKGWSTGWPGTPLDDSVHVARLVMADVPVLLPILEATLSSDEIERAGAFHFEVDRDRYVAARGALRMMLGHYVETDPKGLRFAPNEFGKPSLISGSGTARVSFNVSHTKPLVAFAFARSRRVGIDVELIDPDLPHLQLAERFFSAHEVGLLRSKPEEARVETFFAIWTRKEAYMKGLGEGFSIPSRRFTVSLDGTPGRVADPSGPTTDAWLTLGLETGHNCAGALAVEGHGWELGKFDAVSVLEASRE